MPNLKILFVSFFFLLTAFFLPDLFGKAFATVDACDVTVNPSNIAPNSSGTVSFTVHNDGSTNIIWVKVTRSSSNFTITGGSASSGGWSAGASGSDVVFTGGIQNTGSYIDYSATASTGAETAQASWTVQVSDASDGSGATTCTGETRVAISDSEADVTAPEITEGITVSGVSDTSVKLTWITDEAATSTVNYGTTNSYGSTASETTAVTSHSVTISSLSANTTYHFSVTNTDTYGNSGASDDTTFTISKGATTTTTTTVTVTPKPTATPVPDTTPPGIKFKTDFTKNFTSAPTIEGTATDIKGIAKIEYSVDDGRNWLPVDADFDYGETSVEFGFTPIGLEDGNYTIKVKAIDINDNEATTKGDVLIIDRLPPLPGGSILSIGPQILNNVTLAGLSPKLTLSAIGGPTEIEVRGSKGDEGGQGIKMAKNIETGLWSANLIIDAPGEYKLQALSIDGAGNKTERQIGTLEVLENGQVKLGEEPVENAEVSVYYFDNQFLKFNLWEGQIYGQENPQKTDTQGRYKLMLPAGTYYIQVKALGMRTLKSNIFTVNKTTPFNSDFKLEEKRAFKIGPITIPLPDFRQTQVEINMGSGEDEGGKGDMEGKELPYFDLNGTNANSLKGKPTVLTILSTWLPQASAQLSILEEFKDKDTINLLVVMSQNTPTSVDIYKKRGGYELPMVADRDGILVNPLVVNTLPSHYFMDRKGIIINIKTGVLSKEELLDNLIN